MSVIKTGTTTTTGYVVESDTNGNLVIQTGSSPTTALTLGDDQSATFAGSLINSAGTANGVLYLNGSKVLTTGSVLTFDGAQLGVNGVSVGRGAGAVSTNTAVGASALAANTTGVENAAFGYQALTSNTGQTNTAVGAYAAYLTTTGNGVSAFGNSALQSNTSGTEITGVGKLALQANTTGSYNTAVGRSALHSNTTASNNTAVGYQAGYTTNGEGNTFLGYQANQAGTSGDQNVAIGKRSLGYGSGTASTGSYNVVLGSYAAYSLSSGTLNTFLGNGAGYSVTSGSKNTVIGAYNGNQGGLDIRTASNYIVLSDGDGNPRWVCDGSGNWDVIGAAIIGRDANASGIYFGGSCLLPASAKALSDGGKSLGNASWRWSTVYAVTGTINTSDANQKQDVLLLDDAEKRVATAIKSLIKKYRFKDSVAEKGDAARIHVGAVAQEVQAAFVAEGLDPARYALFCSDTWFEVDGKASADLDNLYTAETPNAVEVTRLGLRYEELLAFVIAAM